MMQHHPCSPLPWVGPHTGARVMPGMQPEKNGEGSSFYSSGTARADTQDKLRCEPERRQTLQQGGGVVLRWPSSWRTHSSRFVQRLTESTVFCLCRDKVFSRAARHT
ncbi:unnamed protein product [Arctogadus glacialis]